MLVDAHLPHITLRQVLQTTKAHENELALAEELAGFLWEDMSEKAIVYAMGLLVKWHRDNDMPLPEVKP